jgi:hypothetical protein
MTGALTLSGPPTDHLHAATKDYVDAVSVAAGAAPPAGTALPLTNGTASVGTATAYAREDHRHATDTAGINAAVTAALAGNLTLNAGTF